MNSKKLRPYILHPRKISSVFENRSKNILFDTDAIVSILAYNSKQILNDLRDESISFSLIDPIRKELVNTKKEKERIDRLNLLDEFEFIDIPITKKEIDYSTRIQTWHARYECFPSIPDLYLGGTLAKYSKREAGNILLFTSNVKDFRSPLFRRKGYIIFQNKQSVKTASLLDIDMTLLPHL
ncbi:hypothetical protein GF389_00510 [Candidatus Dojkabacteria bacterium]|nr:hypothetical protein [Candidatus Dojkabacteria bacterium]